MNVSRFSVIALRLLERLLGGPEREGWAQTLLAIAGDTVRQTRKHPVASLLPAFFFGYGAAAILGGVTLLPGLRLLDQIMVGVAAGWVVGRSGGLPAVATFAALVFAMRSPFVQVPVMGFLDHFRGAEILASHGVAALPYSIAIAVMCIGAGGLWAACQRPVRAVS